MEHKNKTYSALVKFFFIYLYKIINIKKKKLLLSLKKMLTTHLTLLKTKELSKT